MSCGGGGWDTGLSFHPRTKPKAEVGHAATPRPAGRGDRLVPLSDPSIHSSRSHVKAARVVPSYQVRAGDPHRRAPKAGGKGRPTPTRKEAEAAARARAKVPRTRKEQAAAQRAARGDTSRKMRQAMKTGDERYLPARDQRSGAPLHPRLRRLALLVHRADGPAADRDDGARLLRQPDMVQLGNTILFTTLLVIVVDIVMLRFRLRRELARRFPDEPTQGHHALRRDALTADEVHAAAQGAGQDRREAPRDLSMSPR